MQMQKTKKLHLVWQMEQKSSVIRTASLQEGKEVKTEKQLISLKKYLL